MRKNVIALMLVLPLLFVFVIFTVGKVASLGVLISVTGIEIMGKPENNTVRLDLSKDAPYELDVSVKPANASNREYDCYVEPLSESDGAIAVMDGNKIVPRSVGTARIVAESRDGAFRDSITVVITSSLPYDFRFALYHESDAEQTNNLVKVDEEGVIVQRDLPLVTGLYRYSTTILPSGFASPRLAAEEGFEDEVIINESAGTILLPFGGQAKFTVTVPKGNGENIEKHVAVDVVNSDDANILINGSAAEQRYAIGRTGEETELSPETTLYVQTKEGYEIGENGVLVTGATDADGDPVRNVLQSSIASKVTKISDGRFACNITFRDTFNYQTITCSVTATGPNGDTAVQTVTFEFADMSFYVSTESNNRRLEDGSEQLLLLNRDFTFSVVSDMEMSGVIYLWDVIDHSGVTPSTEDPSNPDYEQTRTLILDDTNGGTNTDGSVCRVRATGVNVLVLRVRAGYVDSRTGQKVPYANVAPVRIAVPVTQEMDSIQLTQADSKMLAIESSAVNSLGKQLTVAGNRYDTTDGKLELVENSAYAIDIIAYARGTGEDDADKKIIGASNFNYYIYDPEHPEVEERSNSVAEITVTNIIDDKGSATGQRALVTLKGSGEVTIVVEWDGNDSFNLGYEVVDTYTFNAVKDAVQVSSSPQLYDATSRNLPVVLVSDIMLGTDEAGRVLSQAARGELLQTMRSTYNTEYYKNLGTPDAANVLYALEFKASLYGNGYSINAEYLTNLKDGSSGRGVYFRGPLDFVGIGDLATVAAQDNVVFLCRTDNVTLFNAVLLGCNDSSLYDVDADGNQQLNLSLLNECGTTLEINADVNVINCRIRNGRNVVRAYGGNRDGNGYFIDDRNTIGSVGSDDLIEVRIDGCILSQGREFILKTGANRALRASESMGTDSLSRMEPDLLKFVAEGESEKYLPQTNDYLDDEYFMSRYVLTDVTLKDSVLETSGLFTIGMECNFSGIALYQNSDYHAEFFESWYGTGGTSFASVIHLVGDVRLYDWKDTKLIDSTTLISVNESVAGEYADFAKLLTLDLAAMIKNTCDSDPAFGNILLKRGDKEFVHGGIAVYGGGKNYAQLDFSELTADRQEGLHEYLINISAIGNELADYLPRAAGTQDFRFYMYGADSQKNSYDIQTDPATKKYEGVKAVSAF